MTAAPAAATPTAEFTYKPLLPTLGEPVSLWAGGSVCDARPCTYVWSELDWEGKATILGAGRSLVVRFDSSGLKLLQLKVTNRGYRAPAGPASDVAHRLVLVLPPIFEPVLDAPEPPAEPPTTVESPLITPEVTVTDETVANDG